MAITKLTVENFKSFDKLEVELRPFNIVVGSNASGKSNLLDVIKFLRDIEATSLENAIGIRGGAEILRNFNLDDNQVLRICVVTDDVQRNLIPLLGKGKFGIRTDQTTYEISINFNSSDVGFAVVTDRLVEHFTLLELDSSGSTGQSEPHLWKPRVPNRIALGQSLHWEVRSWGIGRALYSSEDGLIEFSMELPEGAPFSEHDVQYLYGVSTMLSHPEKAMLERSTRTLALYGAARSLAGISPYDFDPSKARQAVPPSGSRDLDSNAKNLSVVLRRILRQPDSKRRLINLVSALLPFVQDLDVEVFGFGQLITKLTERFSDKGHQLPAMFASDGTIACLALVVALYFQGNAVAMFEEPDRHLHPHLAGRVMQMMNEVTERTQVIVTTHNPELLRHANLEDIILVSRNSAGNSEVTRPADSEVLSHFLQNDLGVDDLFVQNLLAL